MPKRDETPYELTEDARRDMYNVMPKGTIVSGDEVKEYGWEDVAKKLNDGSKSSSKRSASKDADEAGTDKTVNGTTDRE